MTQTDGNISVICKNMSHFQQMREIPHLLSRGSCLSFCTFITLMTERNSKCQWCSRCRKIKYMQHDLLTLNPLRPLMPWEAHTHISVSSFSHNHYTQSRPNYCLCWCYPVCPRISITLYEVCGWRNTPKSSRICWNGTLPILSVPFLSANMELNSRNTRVTTHRLLLHHTGNSNKKIDQTN